MNASARHSTLTAAYLYFNAAMLAFLAIWLTLSPEKTATAIGYGFVTSSARSEYLVMYGGLFLGLTAFFCWAARSEAQRWSGLVLVAWLHVGIVPYRITTVATFWPVNSVILTSAAIEVLLLIIALALIFARPAR
jgi:hypothetical protein